MNIASYLLRNARNRAADTDRRANNPATPNKTGEPTLEQLLTFEANNPRPGDRKHERIRSELGLTPSRYFQLLGRHTWSEEALAIDPMTTNRLRRQSRDREIERARRNSRT